MILLPWDLRTLSSPLGPPVRRTARFAPVAITRSPSGKVLVDFGQNLVGRLAIAVQGLAGQAVTLRHAEVLENGDLNIAVYLSRSPNISTVIIGGELHVPTLSFTGLLAQKAMELFSGRANYLHNLSDHRCLCACC
ncbi:MAG: family 78 glycoside hydrolase catalytic domain [Anaerolineae bacterium]|nr:family 78 glycoside hydrolase catalytic domain [Anaerolineae bacterium]